MNRKVVSQLDIRIFRWLIGFMPIDHRESRLSYFVTRKMARRPNQRDLEIEHTGEDTGLYNEFDVLIEFARVDAEFRHDIDYLRFSFFLPS